MVRFELEKNLALLQILIKQHHTEIKSLELDTSGDCPSVIIYYDYKNYNGDYTYSKLLFDFDDDPLDLYRRILDDIMDYAFVSQHKMV